MSLPGFPLGYSTMQFSPRLMAEPPSVFAQIEAAEAAGFKWCALDRHTLWQTEEAGDLERLAAACAERLPCRELQALVLGWDEAQVEEQIKRLCRQAAALRPEVVVVAVKRPPDAVARAQMAAAAERLADLGVRMAIEVSPLFEVATIAAGLEFGAELWGAGIVLDSWHFFLGTDGWDDLRALPSERLAVVHFSDHGELGPGGIHVEKNRRRLPGEGDFDLARFVAEIKSLGYRGGVEVEVVSEELRSTLSPDEYARAAYAASDQYWNQESRATSVTPDRVEVR
jgi:sugar phosphate isomerase/epimerase